MMDEKNFNELCELTEKVPFLGSIVTSNKDNFVEYKVRNGTCFGIGIFSSLPQINVMKAFMSKDTILENHQHDEREWIIVYNGHLIFYKSDNTQKSCQKGEYAFFEIGEQHRVEAVEDTWMIAITIPASEGYVDE